MIMQYLQGLKEYLDENYNKSVFDEALESQEPFILHLHDDRAKAGKIIENLTYDLNFHPEDSDPEIIPKVHVKFLYPQSSMEAVRPLLKKDKKVRDLGLQPILAPGKRYHIKNKSLFPLMKERRVLFFTMLEGELIRGLVAGFTRYEITAHIKVGIPVTLLRHAIYDLRDKKGRCFMKSSQESRRDWEKSPLFVSHPANA
jgi:hypothetical protein